MATIREGNKSVLLVVDLQIGVVRQAWNAPHVVSNVVSVVDRARVLKVPVLWVQHSDDDLPFGSPDWHWAEGLNPAANEVTIHKKFNSSFEETTLDQELAKLGASHITLAGAATNWCIRATAYGALERGYDLTLINDAHTTKTIELANGTRLEASSLIEELNIAMTWLSYPGRKNGTVKSEEVQFIPLDRHE